MSAARVGSWERGGRGLGRGVVVAVLALLLVPVVAGPASAHGRGSDATNYDSRVTAQADVPGVRAAVHGGDELLEIDSPEVEVLVLGYSGEPYLRIGPDGVLRNRASPATYLNEDRYRTELPAGADADPDTEPDWEQVSDASGYAWHDHRIHAMTTALPRQIAEDPDEAQLVHEWQVPLVVDGRETAVAGELHWTPGPSSWPWLLGALVLVLPALVGLRYREPERMVRPAAAVLAAVAVLNLTRVVDDLLAMPLPWSDIALAAVQTSLFVLIGLLGAGKAWRGGDGAATALAVGAAAILVGQGLLYLSVLSASQLTSLLPSALGRMIAALSIAQALTVGPVALLANRRMLPGAEELREDAHASA